MLTTDRKRVGRSVFSRVLLAGLAMGLLLSSSPSESLAKKKKPADVVIIGSSSVNGALGRRIQEELKNNGYHTVRNGKSSTGFARPDFHDWIKQVPSLIKPIPPKAIIVFAGVNDGQGLWLHKKERTQKGKRGRWIYFQHEEPWSKKYEERVRAFFTELCNKGVGRVVMLLPVDVIPKKLEGRLKRIRKLQAAATNGNCGVAISTSGDLDLFKTSRKAKRTFRAEDGVHTSRKGAEAIWKRIGAGLISSLPPADQEGSN